MATNIFRIIASDIRRIPLGVKLVVFVLFVRTLGWGFVDPFYALFLKQFSSSYTLIGFFSSLVNVMTLLMIIPLLRLADHVRDSRIIEDGQIVYFFAILFYASAGYFHNFILLIAAFILHGVAIPLVQVGSEAYIRKHNGGSESRSFGYYTAFTYLGWILGMVLASFTIAYYSFNSMFFFVLPGVLLGLYILPRIRERGIHTFFRGLKCYFHRREDITGLLDDFRHLNRNVVFFLILSLFDGLIFTFTLIFIPLFAVSIDLPFPKIALLMAAMYLPYVFSFFFSEAEDRLKKLSVIVGGLFIGALAFVLLSFIVHQTWILVLVAMTSLSLAIIRPAYNGMITRLTPRSMFGEITGINNLFNRFGMIVGPVLLGYFSDLYGIQFTFFLVALMSLSLGILTLLLRGYRLLTDN